jgi:LysM repeat protein
MEDRKMSAIRPLATIAMLMVLGYFLWTRINTPGLEATAEGELASADLPPLELDLGDEASSLESSPPPFSPTESTAGTSSAPEFEFGPTPDPPANSSITPLDPSDTAAMPDLPPLPANVPTANYTSDAAGAGTVSGKVPSLGTEVPPRDTAVADSLPAIDTMDSMADATSGISPQESSIPADDMPMGVGREFSDGASAFASARTAIDAALEQGELERAHLLLTGWYGDRSLTSDQREEVEELLGQLAGTVVYSPDHRLEAPHTVQAGETLETIAQKYNVPWQLLAKVNGIPAPSAVAPGQELKVIRGPFSAVVDLEQQQLALMVAERYAGKFSVKIEGQATNEGEWVVTQKQMPTGFGGTPKQMVLEPAGGVGSGTTLVIGPASDSAPATAGAIRVHPTDQDDLFDILSIGSKVIIRK